MGLNPAASWGLVSLVLGLGALLIAGLCRVSGAASRAEEEIPLYRHTCSVCGRVQQWNRPFDTFGPCGPCLIGMGKMVEIDLDMMSVMDIRNRIEGAREITSETSSESTCQRL